MCWHLLPPSPSTSMLCRSFQGRACCSCCHLAIVVATVVILAAVIVVGVVVVELLSAASTAATPITASTQSPQSSAAASPLSIATALKRCCHCAPRRSSPSVASVKHQSPLLSPAAAAVRCHLCCCHLAAATKLCQTLSPQSNTPAHCLSVCLSGYSASQYESVL